MNAFEVAKFEVTKLGMVKMTQEWEVEELVFSIVFNATSTLFVLRAP